MFKKTLLPFALAAICACSATSANARDSVRIDATSDATAQESFGKMLNRASTKKQQQLAVAMLKLNLVGVQSAFEVASNPDLQSPSIARIKDRVAGMTADEIMELADRTSDVKVETQIN